MTADRRLLLIDDNPDEVKALSAALVSAGYVIVQATHADDLDTHLTQCSAVIVDEDLGPQKKRGSDIAKAILRKMPEYPVFGFVRAGSGEPSRPSVAKLYDAGCRGVWIKGYDPSEFIYRIGLSLSCKETYDAVQLFLAQRTPLALLSDICDGLGSVPLIDAVWGSGTALLRSNLACNLCAEAQALMGAEGPGQVMAYDLLLKALVVDSHCIQALHTLAAGHAERRFTKMESGSQDCASFLKAALTAAGVEKTGPMTREIESFGSAALLNDPDENEDALLVCCFADDLTHVDYLAFQNIQLQGGRTPRLRKHLGRLSAPRLVLPIKQLATLPSREYSVLDDLVKQGKDHRVIRHRGLVVRAAPGVFGPAIDTLWFNELLHKHLYGYADYRPECVCEIGCGSGFLLCSLVQRYHGSLKHVVAVDSSGKALALAERNLARVLRETGCSATCSFVESKSALEILRDRFVDVLVTNPPYLPSRESNNLGGSSPLFGTDLINDIAIGRGMDVLKKNGRAFVLRSSLTPDHGIWSGVSSEEWEVDDLAGVSLRVPLDLLEVAGDPQWEWVNRDSITKGMFVNPAHPFYQHWHDLSVRRLTRLR